MNRLKTQIQQYEDQIAAKKTLITMQYRQLTTTTRKNLSSPLALSTAFLLGFIVTYKILRKKQIPSKNAKVKPQKHPLVKAVSNVSFWLTLFRIIDKLI